MIEDFVFLEGSTASIVEIDTNLIKMENKTLEMASSETVSNLFKTQKGFNSYRGKLYPPRIGDHGLSTGFVQ